MSATEVSTSAATEIIVRRNDDVADAVELRRLSKTIEESTAKALNLIARMQAPPGSGVFAIWWSFVFGLSKQASNVLRICGAEWDRRFAQPGDRAFPFEDDRPRSPAGWPLLDLATIFAFWRPGSYRAEEHRAWTWAEEFRELQGEPGDGLAKLELSIRALGMTDPIVLGSNGQVWDGHRRLMLAQRLGLERVPVEVADWDERWGLVSLHDEREAREGGAR